jgi:hypothetical protein
VKIFSKQMTIFFALSLPFFSSCGRHSKNLPAEETVNGLALAENPLFAKACFGVVNSQIDTVTTGKNPAVYAVGDKLLMADIKKDPEFGWSFYRNSPSRTGVAATSLVTDSLAVNCDNFVKTAVVLRDISLFSDATLKTQLCTLAAGQLIKADIKYYSIKDFNRAKSFLLTLYPNDLLGPNCPKSYLHASIPTEATRLGDGSTLIEHFLPIAFVYTAP